jgi:hypothetical protein
MRLVTRFTIAALAAVAITACSDAANSRLLAPHKSDAMTRPSGWPPLCDPQANQFVEITAGRRS